MAGSLNHIVNEDGTFRMDLIENLRDARDALEECHQIIAALLRTTGPMKTILSGVCHDLGYPMPKAVPQIQPALHGAESVWRRPGAREP